MKMIFFRRVKYYVVYEIVTIRWLITIDSFALAKYALGQKILPLRFNYQHRHLGSPHDFGGHRTEHQSIQLRTLVTR